MLSDVSLYLVVFFGALIMAVVGTPLARKIGLRLHFMDQPDASRKVHTVPTPRLGGVAIFSSALIAAVLLRGVFQELSSILVGAVLVSFLGLWDDRFTLGAGIKLVGQIIAAVLLIMSGIQIKVFPYPVINYGLTMIWVVGITNALNLLDNMDGLSAGIAAIASAYFALLCALTGQYLVGTLAVAVMAACIGFLIYNWNPATIFMGDSGSLFLGFTLAALGIKLRFPNNAAFVTWMVPVFVLAIPILDTSLVTVSRLRRGLNPLTAAGVDHTSHRLTYAGLSRREAVLVLYVAAFSTGLLAIFITQASFLEGYIAAGLLFIAVVYSLWRLEHPPFWPQSPHAPSE